MVVRFGWGVGCVLWASLCHTALSQDTAGLLDAAVLNGRAQNRSDVFIRDETVHDIGPDLFIKEVRDMRIKVDWDKSTLVALVRASRDQQVELKTGLDSKVRFTGVFAKAGKVWTADRPAEWRESQHSLIEILNTNRIPDTRLVGLQKFPPTVPKNATFDSFVALIGKNRNAVAFDGGRGVLGIRWTSRNSRNPNEEMITALRIDPVSLMPKSHEVVMRLKMPTIERQVMFREAYDWKEKDAVYWPTQITGTEFSAYVPPENGKATLYEINTVAKLHWFDFPESQDNDVLDMRHYDEYDEILRMLEPPPAAMNGPTDSK